MLRRASVLLLGVSLAGLAGAQQPPSFAGNVVVTATGDPEPADQVAAATTVFDADELRAAGFPDIADVLSWVPGALVMRTGLDNGATSLFLRGANANQTLVLFDGVRLNSPFFGGYDWSLPMTAGVGRVEVVRGPYSALYGADAMGGVVQILPDAGQGNALRTLVEGGSAGWRRGELEATARSGAWSVLATAGARDGSGPLSNDDFWSREAMVDAGYDLAGGGRIGVIARRTRSHTDVPFSGATVTPHRFTEASETQLAVPLKLRLGAGTELEASVSRVERSLLYRDPDDPSGFTAEDTAADSDGARVALHWVRDHQRVVAGGEWRRDDVSDTTSFGPNLDHRRLTTRSLFAQDELSLGNHLGLLAGVRWDEADPWGSEVSPRATASWRGAGFRSWVSFGRAFRAPSLGELYYPSSGNPSLAPERSRSAELGVAFPINDRGGELQVVAFSNRVHDLIDFDFASFRFANISRAAQDGVEASWLQRVARETRLRLAVTWLDARDGAGLELLRRPRWSGSAALLGRLTGTLTGEASLVWVGGRADIDPVTFERVSQGGFVTADVGISEPLAAWLSARLRVDNLANRAYQAVRGYPSPGRRVMLGVETLLR